VPPLPFAGPTLCGLRSQPPCTSNPQQQQDGQPITLQTLRRPSSPRALCTNALPPPYSAACLFCCCPAVPAILSQRQNDIQAAHTPQRRGRPTPLQFGIAGQGHHHSLSRQAVLHHQLQGSISSVVLQRGRRRQLGRVKSVHCRPVGGHRWAHQGVDTQPHRHMSTH
jgi:hypothetical protein